jgi:hypothetical protein
MTQITVTEVKNLTASGALRKSHTSKTRGYVSRKTDGRAQTYSGKFGKGFVVYTPNWDSTQFCFVTYYVS